MWEDTPWSVALDKVGIGLWVYHRVGVGYKGGSGHLPSKNSLELHWEHSSLAHEIFRGGGCQDPLGSGA